MPKATWEGTTIAESDDCVVIEGNQYFPPESVRKEYLKPVDKTSVCPWKGVANYYDIVIGENTDINEPSGSQPHSSPGETA